MDEMNGGGGNAFSNKTRIQIPRIQNSILIFYLGDNILILISHWKHCPFDYFWHLVPKLGVQN